MLLAISSPAIGYYPSRSNFHGTNISQFHNLVSIHNLIFMNQQLVPIFFLFYFHNSDCECGMASLVVAEPVAVTMESCVRGYHVYQNTWASIHGECLRCSRERSNRADPFAVAVAKGEDTVGHVPRRFSCATNFFIQSGGVVMCEISGDRRYSRDLPQGGMEIPCVYTFSGAPDLIDKTKQRLNKLQAQIKECSTLSDSQRADLLLQPDSSCKRTSQQILDDPVENVKVSGDKAVNLEVVEIKDCSNSSVVGFNNVWLKIQDITLTLEDKHVILHGLRLSDQHINSVHRLLKQQFPSLNGLRLSLLQDEMKGPTCNATQILHIMTNHWILTATYKSGKVVHVYDSVY